MTDLRTMIAEYLGIPVQHGDEWTILCPSPEHVDHRPSASIYVGEPMVRHRGNRDVPRLPGMWTCYSCGRSGRISNDKIESYTPSTNRNLEVLDLLLEEEEPHVLPEAWLDLYEWPDGIHPYWRGRFAEETCRRHRLGYDYERDCGTYPFRDVAGRVLGVVRRSFDTEATGWKYRYPAGVDKSANLYGYALARRSSPEVVVLVEGALDAVAVDEAGWSALAIYGSRLSEQQARLIRRLSPNRLIFCFDNDTAGADATTHAAGMDLGCYDLRRVSLPPGTKDIAELDLDQRRTVLANPHLI